MNVQSGIALDLLVPKPKYRILKGVPVSLTLVSIPIGHPDDLSDRAKKTLQEADLIIGEEKREAGPFLAKLNLREKPLEILNEHSQEDDLKFLTEQCKTKKVALITDCGTPGFCDPGSDLVKACRQNNIATSSVPGASSLMMLLSLSSVRLDEFVFRGFLPKDNEKRAKAIEEIANEKRAVVLLETPYRLKKFLEELKTAMPSRRALLAINLTQPNEMLLEDKLEMLFQQAPQDKVEFILLIYPSGGEVPKKRK